VKFSQTSRISFVTVLLLTFFTVGIGGITVKHSLDIEIQKVDQSLSFVALSAYENPGQAVGAALFAIEQSKLDATLTLLARDDQRQSSMSQLWNIQVHQHFQR